MTVAIDGSAGITFPNSSTQSIAALGVGQTWQDVTASRVLNTGSYTNTTGKPIMVNVWTYTSATPAGNKDLYIVVGGITVAYSIMFNGGSTGNWAPFVSAVVPNGATYSVTTPTGNYNSFSWVELR